MFPDGEIMRPNPSTVSGHNAMIRRAFQDVTAGDNTQHALHGPRIAQACSYALCFYASRRLVDSYYCLARMDLADATLSTVGHRNESIRRQTLEAEVPALRRERRFHRGPGLGAFAGAQPFGRRLLITVEAVLRHRPRHVIAPRLMRHHDHVPVGVGIGRSPLLRGRGRVREVRVSPRFGVGVDLAAELRLHLRRDHVQAALDLPLRVQVCESAQTGERFSAVVVDQSVRDVVVIDRHLKVEVILHLCLCHD